VKVTIDINVFIDVIQVRQPHFAASEAILRRITDGILDGVFPSHALTTLYYIVRRHISKIEAEQAVDDVLSQFKLQSLETADWRAARTSAFNDLEDAAVAMAASLSDSDYIVTRNTTDFTGSSVPAITPSDFLALYPHAVSPTPHSP
jgi:predicted nucleic acid-binding protein